MKVYIPLMTATSISVRLGALPLRLSGRKELTVIEKRRPVERITSRCVLRRKSWRMIRFAVGRCSLGFGLIIAVVGTAGAVAIQETASATTPTSTPTVVTVSFSQQGCSVWTVPVGVTNVEVDAVGAAGSNGGAVGGDGDGVAASISALTPDQTNFDVCVDEGGGSGDADGGGASGVSLGVTFAAPLVVAGGGGGGGGGDDCNGLCGSGAGGNAGMAGSTVVDQYLAGNGVGGEGADSLNVGMGGAGGGYDNATGGTSGTAFTSAGPGVGGGGGTTLFGGAGGGGGGGYNGGGGGGATGNAYGGGGGGGGADYCGPLFQGATSVTNCIVAPAAGTGTVAGSDAGDAQVTITYDAPTPTLSLSDLSGEPTEGSNQYGVTLTVPQGGPAPSEGVDVTDGKESCLASLSNPSADETTWTGNCFLLTDGTTPTVTASYDGDPNYSDVTAPATLVFDSDGGSAIGSITGPLGTTVSLPDAPVYPGHSFDGWYSAASGGTALSSPYTFSGLTTLYAQWTDTVTFDAEGGSTVASQSGLDGTTITLPDAPSYPGHTFEGWFSAASGGSALTSPYALAGSTILYAQWSVFRASGSSSVRTDTVTFDSDGGSAEPVQTGLDGSIVNLPTPTLTGSTFSGWFTSSSGGSLVTSPHTLIGSTTLYAQWTSAVPANKTPQSYRVVADIHSFKAGSAVLTSALKAQVRRLVTLIKTQDFGYAILRGNTTLPASSSKRMLAKSRASAVEVYMSELGVHLHFKIESSIRGSTASYLSVRVWAK